MLLYNIILLVDKYIMLIILLYKRIDTEVIKTNHLMEIRKKRNMTQKELEKASGVLQQTISLIESGYNTNPGIITMLKLARALRCSVYDLIDEKEGA